MEKKTRNGYVDLLRFLASYVIVFFHLGIAPYYTRDGILGKLPGGALFVEFFFMLSGYFAAKVFIEADKGKEPVIHRFMLKNIFTSSLTPFSPLWHYILGPSSARNVPFNPP